MLHACNVLISCVDCSQHYQDRNGWFSNKNSGPACLFSAICCFPKVSKQYSKCFTAANQDLRLLKLLLGSVKQDTLPLLASPYLRGHRQRGHANMSLRGPHWPGRGSCSLPLSGKIIIRLPIACDATRINHLQEHCW